MNKNVNEVIERIKNDESGWLYNFLKGCKLYREEHKQTFINRKKEENRIENGNCLYLSDMIDEKQVIETCYINNSPYTDDFDLLFVTDLSEINDDTSMEIICHRNRKDAVRGHKNIVNYIKKYGLHNVKDERDGHEYCWIDDIEYPRLIAQGKIKDRVK